MSTVFVDSVDFGEVRIQRSAYRMGHITVVSEPTDPLPVPLKLQVTITNNDQAQTTVPPGLGWTTTNTGSGLMFEISISDFSIPTELPLQITDIAAPTSEPRTVNDVITVQAANGGGAPIPGISNTAPLTGQIVDPATVPVTVQLLIDRGRGMRDYIGTTHVTRTAAVKMACQYGLLLLTEDDWVGVMGTSSTAPAPGFANFLPAPYAGNHKTDIDTLFAGLMHPSSGAPLSSIAAGVAATRSQLSSMAGECVCFPGPGAIIVLTDGAEGTPPAVATLPPSSIPTYAVGAGSATDPIPVNLTTIMQLAGGNGYVLVCPPKTGLGSAEAFAIAKYLIQVIASLRNGGVQVILDPCGKVQNKKKPVRIPFTVSKADRELTIIVLTQDETALRGSLIGPNGKPTEPTRLPGAGNRLVYRINRQKRQVREKCDGIGRWHLELEHSGSSANDAVDFSVVVLADSDLQFEAQLHPREIELGESFVLSARLHEGGAPLSSALAHVFAEVTYPDGSTRAVPLKQSSPGSYQAQLACPIPGVLHARVLARGRSFQGIFQREQTVTGHVVARERRYRRCCHCHEKHEPSHGHEHAPSRSEATPGKATLAHRASDEN
ncbi:MAG TPA: hypothetical protein VG937_20820 [Polyangiaceae bacterium]|nr:hypothetical protein [Polyangiaceae bacterium]